MSNIVDKAIVGLAAASLAIGVYAVLRPSGPGGHWIAEYKAEKRTRAILAQDWRTFASAGARVSREGAQVSVVEFADYECPFCRLADTKLEAYIAIHPGLGLEFVNYPIPELHPAATGAALAAICADKQGRFRAMHRELMTTTRWQADSDWVREAALSGVSDIKHFRTCLTDSATSRLLRTQIDMGRELGVTGTPTFAMRTRIYDGVISPDSLFAMASAK